MSKYPGLIMMSLANNFFSGSYMQEISYQSVNTAECKAILLCFLKGCCFQNRPHGQGHGLVVLYKDWYLVP